QLTLSQAAIYMATAPKSNASAKAIWSAMSEVKEGRTLPVPKALKDSHYAAAKSLGHGKNYINPHKNPDEVDSMDYLGVDRIYYRPTDRGFEAEIAQRIERFRSRNQQEIKTEASSVTNS
ncbi:MAG: replication-associated recombination protein A, partial [Planctomycetota bacterium]|nr:replication-associated recombination protein A [Planctomycetota bacterium]